METNEIKVGHDSVNPPNLISFMLKNWKKPSDKLPGALKNLKYIQARRKALSEKFPEAPCSAHRRDVY